MEFNTKKLSIGNKTLKIRVKTKILKNKSPLRYPGGKTRACKILTDILENNFNIKDYKTLISPFFGGGSFEFHLQNKYNMNLLVNDKFKPLYTFWVNCKTNNKELCNALEKNLGTITKDKFISLRENIMDEKNSFEQAISYFIINRCSFSGATLSGGFSLESSTKRFTISSIDNIKKLDLEKFEISNLDFEKFIDSNIRNDVLIFLDPPYYLEKNSKLYGKDGDMHETFDHIGLYKCLSDKNNWMMTYNNCEYIRDLYKDYKIIDTKWSYGMNKSKESSEIVILNT
jgi:DNA adenine methylase